MEARDGFILRGGSAGKPRSLGAPDGGIVFGVLKLYSRDMTITSKEHKFQHRITFKTGHHWGPL